MTISVEKSNFVLSLLIATLEVKVALVEEGEIPVLVETVEMGTQRWKGIVVCILLQLYEDDFTLLFIRKLHIKVHLVE